MGHANQDHNNQGHAHRVIASLNREQVDYLDQIGKDAQFSSGIKLSRTPSKLTTAPPERSEHSEQILAALGYSDDQVADFRTRQVI